MFFVANTMADRIRVWFVYGVLVPVILWLAGATPTVYAEPMLRPMKIHEVPELGLEIWTEVEPAWLTDLVEYKGRYVLTTQTPPLTHPPAAMTFAGFPGMKIADSELEDVAKTVVREAAANFHATVNTVEDISINRNNYGALSGFEAVFDGVADGNDVSVKVFLGQSSGEMPVLLQAYTLRGKLDSIAENVRRAWTSVDYLDHRRIGE